MSSFVRLPMSKAAAYGCRINERRGDAVRNHSLERNSVKSADDYNQKLREVQRLSEQNKTLRAERDVLVEQQQQQTSDEMDKMNVQLCAVTAERDASQELVRDMDKIQTEWQRANEELRQEMAKTQSLRRAMYALFVKCHHAEERAEALRQGSDVGQALKLDAQLQAARASQAQHDLQEAQTELASSNATVNELASKVERKRNELRQQQQRAAREVTSLQRKVENAEKQRERLKQKYQQILVEAKRAHKLKNRPS
eukprot:TRINITY_DN7287_c0_g3_i3.p1 TRINITY_DN7287_c0_g3~~TRINITY_DN7287_c0_g3_i3.p1  ORF type:complete len:255 (-),score=58.28 TRINITY_DN7287_c0_g3_i3:308-1072(-)